MMTPLAHRLTGAGLLLLGALLACLAAGCTAAPARETAAPPTLTPTATRGTRSETPAPPLPTLTPISGIKATLTALPNQPPMPEDQARAYQELRAAVERCAAYNENRKLGILSQIDYVLRPATVPPDFVTLYGDAWPARLIYGAAYLSALEWKLGGRDPASCLYPIGATFNALLRDLGQSTFPEFP
ncbi:MAG: hypothetical protein QG637_1761 [Chloroflexota bacterium]|nr:hypothetical protein [Chloroflexota bacterium]